MAATIKSIAKAAKVSHQTVWRALNDEARIAPETKLLVRAIAKELNYRPNRLAASLRTQRSKTIGLIVLDVSNAFTGAIAKAIEREAAEFGFSVILANSDGDIVREEELISSFVERRVDGIIISGAEGEQLHLSDIPDSFPMVAINKPLSIPSIPCVRCNNFQVGQQAARYLMDRGHTAVAGIFGPFANTPFLERYNGFVAELASAGMKPHKKCLLTGTNSSAFGQEAFQTIWEGGNRPTGVFSPSYRLTEGVLRAIDMQGLRRGSDIELLGFDIQYADLLQPPLAVFRQPVDDIAWQAVDKIIHMIGGDPITSSDEVLEIPFVGVKA